jgi:hypothetical protein
LTSSTSTYRPVSDQLILGAFIRTLMHVSAALESLLSQYPDLIQRAKPFGMSIGIEVFALAQNPLIDKYPALKTLVLSFKNQFSELGIDPRMVRRATHLHVHSENDDASADAGAEAQLRAWLGGWLGSVNTRRSTGAEWLLSSEQVRELLGPDLYPYLSTELGKESDMGVRPSQEHLDCITDILGPHILSAMLNIWTSPQTRVFANPVIADMEDFAGYVADVVRLEGGEPAVQLEEVFPHPQPLPEVEFTKQMLALQEWHKAQRRREREERYRMLQGTGEKWM